MSTSKLGVVLLLPLLVTACTIEEGSQKAASGGSAGVGGSGGATSGSAGGGIGGNGAAGGSGSGGVAGSAAAGGNAGTLGGGGGLGGMGVTSGGAGAAAGGGAGGAGSSGAGAAGSSGAGMAGAAGGGAGAAGTAGSGGAGGAGAAGTAGIAGSGGAGAGGSAGNAGSAGSAGAGFRPCPNNDTCTILPLGDSITDGYNVAGGYRMKLFSLALADDKDMTFVGGSMNGPPTVDGQPFPRSHEGHSGWTIQQIDGIVPSPALNVDPHIILLHIGTNDLIQNLSGATARLETLVDQIIAGSPDALLAVATVVPYPASENAVDAFNAAVPGIVAERANAGKHVILVDQFEGFPNSELADGIHPNQAGYDRMAAVWYAAISDYL